MKKIFLVGAGGHCRSCIDVIESTGLYQIAGLFDLKQNIGQKVCSYEVIGSDEDIKKYISSEAEFLITLGQIKSVDLRLKTAQTLGQLGAKIATVVSPRAYVARTASIGAGTIVMHDVLVNSHARVAEHCILNTKSLIEHDAVIENFCHISTGAILNGHCHVLKNSFVGSLSVLQEGLVVPEGSVLAAGTFHKKSRVSL